VSPSPSELSCAGVDRCVSDHEALWLQARPRRHSIFAGPTRSCGWGIAGAAPSAPGVSDGQRGRQQPFGREMQFPLDVMGVNHVAKAAQTDRGRFVSEVENVVPIWRLHRLAEHHEEVIDARLAGTVTAEEDGQRCELKAAGASPCFEVLDAKPPEHARKPTETRPRIPRSRSVVPVCVVPAAQARRGARRREAANETPRPALSWRPRPAQRGPRIA
jgi:hypothetical protein